MITPLDIDYICAHLYRTRTKTKKKKKNKRLIGKPRREKKDHRSHRDVVVLADFPLLRWINDRPPDMMTLPPDDRDLACCCFLLLFLRRRRAANQLLYYDCADCSWFRRKPVDKVKCHRLLGITDDDEMTVATDWILSRVMQQHATFVHSPYFYGVVMRISVDNRLVLVVVVFSGRLIITQPQRMLPGSRIEASQGDGRIMLKLACIYP